MLTPIEQVDKAIATGKIGGSWLITGGYESEQKAFAGQICSTLLGGDMKNLTAFHPDLKLIECGLTEESKKEIQKNILAGKALDEQLPLSRKQEITVDDIRGGIQFLSLKTAPNKWKILIINPIDRMNDNAANALLKALEEPSEHTVILLLCRNTGHILPTIKSRCRRIQLRPLSQSELVQKIKELYPDIQDAEGMAALSEGSLGLVQMIYTNNGLILYNKMISVLTKEAEIESIKSFVSDACETEETFSLTKGFLLNWLYARVRQCALSAPFIAEDFMDLYQESEKLFADIDRIYLDKKQVLQNLIFKIQGALP